MKAILKIIILLFFVNTINATEINYTIAEKVANNHILF